VRNIERRRMETLLADEEAKEARLRKEQENRAAAMAMKVDAARAEEQRQAAEEKLQARHKAVVAEVQSRRDRPLIAKEEVVQKNKKDARVLRSEIEQMEAARAAERRLEEARRADLIKQIRALELVPRKREARLDPTYTPQLGLLEEMSLAELRERLLIVEEQQLEDEEARRTKIKLEKDEKQTDLAQRAGRLAEMRERAAVEASTRREQTKAAERAAVEATRERVADAQLKVKAEHARLPPSDPAKHPLLGHNVVVHGTSRPEMNGKGGVATGVDPAYQTISTAAPFKSIVNF
jgi:hypothetical protein